MKKPPSSSPDKTTWIIIGVCVLVAVVAYILLKPKDEEEEIPVVPSVLTKTPPPPPQAPVSPPPLAPVSPPPLAPVSPPGLDLTGTPAPAPLGLPPVFGPPVTAPSPIFGSPAPSPVFGSPAPEPASFDSPAPAPSPIFGSPAPAPSPIFGSPEPASFDSPAPSPDFGSPEPASFDSPAPVSCNFTLRQDVTGVTWYVDGDVNNSFIINQPDGCTVTVSFITGTTEGYTIEQNDVISIPDGLGGSYYYDFRPETVPPSVYDNPSLTGSALFSLTKTTSPVFGSPAPSPDFGSPAPSPDFGSPAPSPIFGSPAPSPIFGSPAPAPPRPYFEPLFTVDAGTSTLRESGNEIVLVPSGDSDNRYYLRKVTITNDDYPNFNVLFPGVTLPNTNVEEIYLRIDNTYITRVIYENSQEPFRYGFYSDLYGNSGQPVGGYPDPTTPIRKIEIGRIQRNTSIFSGFTVQYEIGPGSDYYIQVVNIHNLSYTQYCVIDFYNLSNGGEWYQDIFERKGTPIPNLNDSLRYSHVLVDDIYLLELYKPFLQGRVNIIAGHADRNRNLINNDFGKGNSPSYRIVTTSLKFGNFTGRTAADQNALPLFGRDVIPHPVSNWSSGDNRNYPLTSQNGQWYMISTENWVTWNRFYYSSYGAMLETENDEEFNLRNGFASDFEDIFINGTTTKARRLLNAPINPNIDKVIFWYNDTD